MTNTSTPSNTLVISGLTRQEAEDASFSSTLKSFLEQSCQVEIVDWVLIKSFKRIIAVFLDENDCHIVKEFINQSKTPSNIKNLKSYFTTPTLLDEEDERRSLQLPDKGRLWLISPPPSPPAGWESSVESEPNKEAHYPGLAPTLHEALSKVALKDNHSPSLPDRPSITRRVTLRESNLEGLAPLNTDITNQSSPRSASPVTPSIIVEWDDDGEDSDPLSHIHSSLSNYFPRTELPPSASVAHS